MAKPPAEVGAQIALLSRNDNKRPAELLHVTLLSLFDRATAKPEWLPAVIAAMDDFYDTAFPLAFDAIEERRAVTLRTRAPLSEARAFQTRLIRFLLGRGVPCLGTTPVPHCTINYSGDGRGRQTIAPIGWTVEEILLIESIVGKTRHVVHGRWQLGQKGRQ